MEKEFLKDLVELNEAIENFGYLDEEILEESLSLHIRSEDMDKLLQIPIGKLFATLNNNDVFAEMREHNKKLADYKMTGKDSILTVNKMKIYVYINGNTDQKELMKEKIASLEKKIEASHKKPDATFDIPYGSIRAIYSLYKRVEKSTLKEDVELEEKYNPVSDAKFALKNDPQEYVYWQTIAYPPLRLFFGRDNMDKKEELAMRRVEKLENYSELRELANKLKKVLAERPIDRAEANKLVAEFKKAYKHSTLKKDVENDVKIEKVEAKRKASLSEAVTFVDNAGQLRTTSAEDYEKSMHNSHQLTQIKREEEVDAFYREFNLVKKFNVKKDKDGNIISIYED